MNKYGIKLCDGTEIYAANVSLEPMFTVNAINREEIMEIWNLLTKTNLSHISLLKDGVSVGTFYDTEVVSVQIVNQPNGTVSGHFYLKGFAVSSVDEERDMYVQAAKILLGEEE